MQNARLKNSDLTSTWNVMSKHLPNIFMLIILAHILQKKKLNRKFLPVLAPLKQVNWSSRTSVLLL